MLIVPAMSDRPDDINLKPGEYRHAFRGPLDSPGWLWFGALVLGLGTLGAAWAAAQLLTPWASLLPIPPALGCGICLAGLFPRYWFGRDN
jgi:hypothetical protein